MYKTESIRWLLGVILLLLVAGFGIFLWYSISISDTNESPSSVLNAHTPVVSEQTRSLVTEAGLKEKAKSLGVTYEMFIEALSQRIEGFVEAEELSETKLKPGEQGTFVFYQSVGDIAEIYGVVRSEDDALMELGILFEAPKAGQSGNHASIEIVRIGAELANPFAPAKENGKAAVTAVLDAIKHSNEPRLFEMRVGDLAYTAEVVNPPILAGLDGNFISLTIIPK